MSNNSEEKKQKEEKARRPRKRPDLAPHPDPGDNTKYLKHTLNMWNWKQPDMMNPQAVRERIEQYFELCLKDDMKPSIEGLAYAFGVDRRSFWRWVNERRLANMPEECKELLRRARETMGVQLTNYMQNGKINPVAGIFLMKNNFDYEDKKEITVAPINPLGEETSPEDLHRKYIDVVEVEKIAERAESD